MQFDKKTFKKDLTDDLISAFSFVFDADANVKLGKQQLVRKVLSTSIYTLDGEFIAGQLYGKFQLSYTMQVNTITVAIISISLLDENTFTDCDYSTPTKFCEALQNMHKLLIIRSTTKSKRDMGIKKILDSIEAAETLDEAKSLATNIRKFLE